MKQYILCLALFLPAHYLLAQTQMEINEDAYNNLLKSDKKLNQVYQQVLKVYKADTVFIKNLKTAQQQWIKFRDAEMDMMFPKREDGYYGSIHPMCRSFYQKELTDERTKKLTRWLKETEDDNGCTSSINIPKND